MDIRTKKLNAGDLLELGRNPCAICESESVAVVSVDLENPERFGVEHGFAIWLPVCQGCIDQGLDAEYIARHCLGLSGFPII